MKRLKVICIMGKSGTGKSTVVKELCKNDIFNYVKSFTTRKERINDPSDKETHVFVSKDHYLECEKKSEILALYVSKNDYVSYTTKKSFDKEKINIYVIDPIAFNDFSKLKGFDVTGIYLKIDEKERTNRFFNREKNLNKFSKEEELDESQIHVNNYFSIDVTNLKVTQVCDIIEGDYDKRIKKNI